MASERCACGHDLHEPGQCGDKRLTFDCGCSYSPDTQPAPREAEPSAENKVAVAQAFMDEFCAPAPRKAGAMCPVCGYEGGECLPGTKDHAEIAALRAEVERLAEALREIAQAFPTCGGTYCLHHECKMVRVAAAALKRDLSGTADAPRDGAGKGAS